MSKHGNKSSASTLQRSPDDRLLTPAEVAEKLQVKTGTLAKWRREKVKGPPFVVLSLDGKTVRYWQSDLMAYLECGHTSPISIG